jgi:hypothetical protein
MLTAIYGVDGGKGDEEAQVGLTIPHAVEAKPHSRQDCHGVLSAVDEVRKHIPRVVVTSDALQGTPYRRQSGEEAQKTRVRRVALHRIVPTIRVQTEEELNVLRRGQST